MFLLKKLLTSLILPPAGPLLLALLLTLIALRRARQKRPVTLPLSGALVVMLSLTSLSLPVVANALLQTLETFPAVSHAQLREGKIEAIVILGGGSYYTAPEYAGDTVNAATLERLRYGARLARASHLPILVTGGAPFGGEPEGQLMAQALATDFAQPARWIEGQSADTAENARLSATQLHADGIRRIALVSHAWHLRRAVPLFAAQGLQVLAAPTGFATASPSLIEGWLPSSRAFNRSSIALHEMLGHTLNSLSRSS